MNDCIFCRILAGELPASFVYRDEDCAAFMDIQPVNEGHLLVVPTRHGASLADIDVEIAGKLMRVAHRLTAALRASDLRCEGVNFFLADGEAAMQEVFHVHLHVFPRYKGDGFGLKFSAEYYTRRPSRAELDRAATTLRELLPTDPSAPVFYHGTRAMLVPGDLLQPGYASNYTDRKSPWIYFSATLGAATWGAELARGEGPGRIYVVEPIGAFMDDPNLTDKKFPGNPTKSYRSREPLRVVRELLGWQGHSPEAIQAMKAGIEGKQPIDD